MMCSSPTWVRGVDALLRLHMGLVLRLRHRVGHLRHLKPVRLLHLTQSAVTADHGRPSAVGGGERGECECECECKGEGEGKLTAPGRP